MAHAAADMNDNPNPLLQNTEPYQQDIINVLRRSIGAECTEIHDRIYGVLNMSSVNIEKLEDPRDIATFWISYDEHPTETFQRLAKYIIDRDNSLNILFLTSTFQRRHSTEIEGRRLSSWVPDWRYDIGQLQFGLQLPQSKHISPEDQPAAHPTVSFTQSVTEEHPPAGHWSRPLQQYIHKLSLRGHILADIEFIKPQDDSSSLHIYFQHPLFQQYTPEVVSTQAGACVSDKLAVLEGARAPVLLRPTTTTSTYAYVGPVDRDKTTSRQWNATLATSKRVGVNERMLALVRGEYPEHKAEAINLI